MKRKSILQKEFEALDTLIERFPASDFVTACGLLHIWFPCEISQAKKIVIAWEEERGKKLEREEKL